MPLVLNASSKDYNGKALGNYHSIPAGKSKNFSDNVANYLITMRGDYGLVGLPEEFEDPSFAATDDGKRILEEKKKEGVEKRVTFLRKQAYNEQVSLQRDLEIANWKVDPKTFASDTHVAQLEELVAYRKSENDDAKKRAERVAELQKELKKV